MYVHLTYKLCGLQLFLPRTIETLFFLVTYSIEHWYCKISHVQLIRSYFHIRYYKVGRIKLQILFACTPLEILVHEYTYSRSDQFESGISNILSSCNAKRIPCAIFALRSRVSFLQRALLLCKCLSSIFHAESHRLLSYSERSQKLCLCNI